MDLGLRGRVAIVCAASQGLGKATAAGFAGEGAHVVICSRNRKRINAAAEEIRKVLPDGGVEVLPVVADLRKARDIRNMVAAARKRFSRIDVLVTNAGGPPVATFPDLTDRIWEQGIEQNLMSTIRCIREVLPHMVQEGWGRIVNITSISAKQPIDDLVISSTVRPGILGLSKVLANQNAKDGVLINNVTPGYILTARQRELADARAKKADMSLEEYLKGAAAEIPAQRLGDPEELANVIVFLASEKASYVTGATISVDGGLTKGLL
jgi:3-oxoacyl-[acyl-carrier protein] reductase